MKIKDTIGKYMHKNRGFLCIFLLLCLFCVFAVIFTANDYFIYGDKTIVKVTSVSEEPDHVEFSFDGQQSETITHQILTATIKNGARKGEVVTIENDSSESSVYDVRFRRGDELFVNENRDGAWKIEKVKHDTYIVAMLAITFLILFVVGRFKGVLAFASVALNAMIFHFALRLYVSGTSLILLSVASAFVFTVVCLTLIGGFTKMTLISIVSTFSGAIVTFGIACAVIYALDFKGLYVEGLEYLIRDADYRVTFMSELLIGGLGATMDIAISISSALCELKEKDPKISFSALMRSGREIGKDISGTMTNVLLFTYLCGGIPLMMLMVRGGVPMMKYVFGNNNLEIARFLVGSIGIVLTVPISYFVASVMLSRRKRGGK